LLADAKAVALSYAWGEFDRRPRLIGHTSTKRPIYLTLGDEWILSETIETLAELCTESNDEENKPEMSGIWIDQLCVPQRE